MSERIISRAIRRALDQIKRKIIIYIATNRIDGKRYIGQTVLSLEKRKAIHINDVKNDSECVFHRAIRKHGEKNFKWEVVFVCYGKEESDAMEIKLIKELGTKVPLGYNMTDGGGGMLGLKPTDETLVKMSEAKIGIKHTPERNAAKSERQTGTKHTDEHKASVGKGLMGNTNGKGNKGKKRTPEHIANREAGKKRVQEVKLQAELINGRICSICGELFPLTEEYFRWTKYRGRFRRECRECEGKSRKKYNEDHKEEINEKKRKRYEENKEELKEKRERKKAEKKQKKLEELLHQPQRIIPRKDMPPDTTRYHQIPQDQQPGLFPAEDIQKWCEIINH